MNRPKHSLPSSFISCISFADRKMQGGHMWVYETIHRVAASLDRGWTGPCEPVPMSQVCVLTTSESLSERVAWIPQNSHHRGGLLLVTPRIWNRPEARIALWRLAHLGHRLTVRALDPSLYGDPSHQAWRVIYYAKPAWSIVYPDPTHMPWPGDDDLQLAGLGLYAGDEVRLSDTRGKALRRNSLPAVSSTQEWDRFPLSLKAHVERLFVNLGLVEDTVPCYSSTPSVSGVPVERPPTASGSVTNCAPTSFATE